MSGPPASASDEAAELAKVVAQIAKEDPAAAAGLLGVHSLGAPDPCAPISAFQASAPVRGAGLLEAVNIDDDFDVDLTMTVAVVGNTGVGKSSLIERFVRGNFSEEYRRTMAAKFAEKKICIAPNETSDSSQELMLHIWDVPGGDDVASLVQANCKNIKAVAIAFAVDDRASFESVSDWVAALRQVCGSGVPLVLVKTKEDLRDGANEPVTDEDILALSKSLGAHVVSCSASQNQSTRLPFEHLSGIFLRNEKAAEERFRSGEAKGGLVWDESALQSGGCAWGD
eukprot:TRINITY_DN19098_c0_g1_i1.p1 TRINITY_DN19098_c0_g1~~TRINITY_DN19098_c0_g1_i1.p1  ORF type:complete len:300 (-),score=57.11 TRINITY_DN19098_c0_g1_i1:114-965(-)